MRISERTARIATDAVSLGCALQKPAELAGLLTRAASVRPRVIVEIGSDPGGTLYAWRAAFPAAHVAGISLQAGRNVHGATDIAADSHDPETRARIVSWLAGRPIDLLFINGDHTYEGASLDFQMYAPLVRLGGLLVFHDLIPDDLLNGLTLAPPVGVHRLWRELPGKKEELVAEPVTRGGIGIVEVSAEVIKYTRRPKRPRLRIVRPYQEPEDINQRTTREFLSVVAGLAHHRLEADLARKFGDEDAALRAEKLGQEANRLISIMTRDFTPEDLAALPEILRSTVEEARGSKTATVTS